MYYSDFKGLSLSKLGFGLMRLPQKTDGTIDKEQMAEMTAYAINNGVNYFDTAYPYHGGMSETAIGEILEHYQRESFFLTDKFPGHQTASSYNPKQVFEEQLRRCKVDYFDFYLMHNVCESSIDVYLDPKWGILDYFVEQKKAGRIRHLGFSCHAELDTLKRFLASPYGEHMEMIQIQLNYLDWTLQKAREKVEYLNSIAMPIWVMEPLRGGKLVDEEGASNAFRWLMDIPGVEVVLSGMSSFDQMKDNINTFDRLNPLSDEEKVLLYQKAEKIKNSVPCTGCSYCTKWCPMELDIPILMQACNDMRMGATFTPIMRMEHLPEGKRPSDCLHCGECRRGCPQKIDIPEVIAELNERLAAGPKWSEICRQREEADKKMMGQRLKSEI